MGLVHAEPVRRLAWRPILAFAVEPDRVKVSVQRHHDAVLFQGPCHNLIVWRFPHPDFPNMRTLISKIAEPGRCISRHSLIQDQAHGTPDPGHIRHGESAGCIRMTNWDVAALSHMVRRGTPIDLEE